MTRTTIRKPALLMTSMLVASALIWTLTGGIESARGQTSSPGVEIHRAHQGSYAPEPNKPVFILVLGSDAGSPRYRRGGRMERGRADSVHILAINGQKDGATLIGFPRDSYVQIPGHGADKLTHGMFFGGPELMVRTIEQLANIRFDYYMLTNFQGLADMTTEFGGLTINVPYPMSDRRSGAFFGAGVRKLNGAQTLAFTRNRYDAPRGDFDRSFNQGSVMAAAQVQARREVAQDPTKVLSYLRIVRRFVRSDIPLVESLRLGLLVLRITPANVKNRVLDGRTGSTPAGSSVILTPAAMAMLRDVADDGIIAG